MRFISFFLFVSIIFDPNYSSDSLLVGKAFNVNRLVQSPSRHANNNGRVLSLIQVVSKDKLSDDLTTREANITIDTASNNTATIQRANSNTTIQARLEEARQRQGKGETLTQDYCDNLLGTCVAQNEWDSVLDVLDIMKQQGLRQVKSTYRACLQLCFEAANAASSQEILNAMKQANVQADVNDISLVVATICRADNMERGAWRAAMPLVNAHRDLPIEAYDAVLSCMVVDAQWKDAVRLLRQMERGNSTKPAVSTYRTVIECCVSAYQAEQAVQVLQSCIKQGGLTPTVYCFELVIAALAKKLQWRRAMQLLDIMDELQVPKTIVIFNAVLTACAKAREVVHAKSMLVKMKKSGIQPDIISYNAVMSACASTSRWKDALTVLDQCHREPGVSPDIYTYTNAIRACAKGGKTRRALSLFQVVKDKKLPVDAYCYTAAIDACAKANLWKSALDLLDEMDQRGVEPSEVTYSVAITACGNSGHWEKALELLDLMRDKGMEINLITYNAAITTLSKAAKQYSKSHDDNQGLWKKALDLLDMIRTDGHEPDGFSFTSAISCCGAEGRWEEALRLIDIMQGGGPRTRPNKIAYTAAIASCGRAGQVDHAIRLFRQMNEQGLSADRVAYNALFAALRVAKKTESAYELWNEMSGKRHNDMYMNATIATARADESTTPDIITLTEAIAAISADPSMIDKVDLVFAEAVDQNIILRQDSLDSVWDVDLSGMSFPVARAACRFILHRLAKQHPDGKDAEDLVFITGVGKHHQVDDTHPTSLREYVRYVLKTDFTPPLASEIPALAQGTVEIRRATLEEWIRKQVA